MKAMPRYYFHIRSTDYRYDDPEGSELMNDEAAINEALVSARELSADRIRQGLSTNETAFEVQDSEGAVVGTVLFPRASA